MALYISIQGAVKEMSPQCRVYMAKVIPLGGWQLNDVCVCLDSDVLCTVIIILEMLHLSQQSLASFYTQMAELPLIQHTYMISKKVKCSIKHKEIHFDSQLKTNTISLICLVNSLIFYLLIINFKFGQGGGCKRLGKALDC